MAEKEQDTSNSSDTYLKQELQRVGADDSPHSFGERSTLEQMSLQQQEARSK